MLRVTGKAIIFFHFVFFAKQVLAHDIVETIAKVKPSVVGVGIFDPLGTPRAQLKGTGFVIGNGDLVVTNYHVVAGELDPESRQKRAIFSGDGRSSKTIEATIVEFDAAHDLAILKINGRLPALKLASSKTVRDGTEVAFTGYPIGAILGLYAATHRGMIAAYTPVVIPSQNADQLSIEMIKRLKDPYFVYQMDATAYPGNSGSPVYNVDTGEVVAIINKVFVKKSKEAVLSDPSGITYSIPVKYLSALLKGAGLD